MRSDRSTAAIQAACHTIALVLGLSALAGCATLRSTLASYETGTDGIARPQQRLRESLASGDFPSALAWREDDELLSALNRGIASYYASQFARSAAVLDSAALLADDRITASVSKDALALMTNDAARPYHPRRTERLFIAYYGMLAYAKLERWEDAAVEARRLVALLGQYDADRDDEERAVHAVMRELAGTVFQRAGERGEASVAFRGARALRAPTSDSGVWRPRAAGEGDVLIVVERGFVAHRVTESLNVHFGDEDADSLSARGCGHKQDVTIVDAHHRCRKNTQDGYWLAVALPALRQSHDVRAGDPIVLVDGVAIAPERVSATVDDAAGADARRERTEMLTRAVARVSAKYVLTKAVKDAKGETAGKIANIGASLLERADVRSWHLLPRELVLLHVRVPAGARRIELALNEGGSPIVLGQVDIRAGGTSVLAMRLWPGTVTGVLASRGTSRGTSQATADLALVAH